MIAHYSTRGAAALARGETVDPESYDVWGCHAEEIATIAVAEIDAADARRCCSYCDSTGPVAILVGWTPGGDECRKCPVCLSEDVLPGLASFASKRAVAAYTERVTEPRSRSVWA